MHSPLPRLRHGCCSGGSHARGTLKKRWRSGIDRQSAIQAAVEALYDAAHEDVATGGPDPLRNIYPSVRTITAEGVIEVPGDDVRAAFEAIVSRD